MTNIHKTPIDQQPAATTTSEGVDCRGCVQQRGAAAGESMLSTSHERTQIDDSYKYPAARVHTTGGTRSSQNRYLVWRANRGDRGIRAFSVRGGY